MHGVLIFHVQAQVEGTGVALWCMGRFVRKGKLKGRKGKEGKERKGKEGKEGRKGTKERKAGRSTRNSGIASSLMGGASSSDGVFLALQGEK